MIYNVDFEVTALCALMIFVVFLFLRNPLDTLQNQLFKALAVDILFVTVLDISTSVMSPLPDSIPLWVGYAENAMDFALSGLMGWLILSFLIAYLGHVKWLRHPFYPLTLLPAIVYTLLLCSAPFTGMFFYYNERREYCFGTGHVFTYLVPASYVLAGIVLVVLCARRVARRHLWMLSFFCVLTLGCTALQMFVVPHVLLTYFGGTFAMLMFYVTAQRPEVYQDGESGLFNRMAFAMLADELLDSNRTFTCTLFFVPNYAALTAVFSYEETREFVQQISSFLRAAAGHSQLFRFTSGCVVALDRGDVTRRKLMMHVAERFENSWQLRTTSTRASVRMLQVHCPSDCTTLTSLYRTIDALMQRASESGDAGEVMVSSEEMQERLQRSVAVQRAVEQALATDSLEIYLQPIVEAGTGRVVSAEVLARLQDEALGLVPPDEFIPLVEHDGSILRLGEQIFAKSCRFAAENQLFEHGIESLHINLSLLQCAQVGAAEKLINMAARSNVPMSRLRLELTESATMSMTSNIRHNLDVLRAAGCVFAMDDYGTGYSNMSRISDYGIGVIKLDKSLVWDYCGGKTANLEYLVPMFKADGLRVVAEGVETLEQAETLAALRCDYLQGYYYARPLPRQDFLAFLRTYSADAPALRVSGWSKGEA